MICVLYPDKSYDRTKYYGVKDFKGIFTLEYEQRIVSADDVLTLVR